MLQRGASGKERPGEETRLGRRTVFGCNQVREVESQGQFVESPEMEKVMRSFPNRAVGEKVRSSPGGADCNLCGSASLARFKDKTNNNYYCLRDSVYHAMEHF